MTLIEFGQDIECLIAKTDPIVVSLYQPQLNLVANESLGPHHSADRIDAETAQIEAFLRLSFDRNSKLIVFPEYCFPQEVLLSICRHEIEIPAKTLLIAPLETISADHYRALKGEIETIGCECQEIDITNNLMTGCCVNACAIVALKENGVSVFLQPKRHKSRWERASLCENQDYFIFKGSGVALTVLICSDANNTTTYDGQLLEMHTYTGKFIIHTQWNPDANNGIYNEFWKRSLFWGGTERGASILISSNVATGSTIRQETDGSQVRVPISHMRMGFNGDGKPDESYMSDDSFSAFKSIIDRTHGKTHGQCFNLIYPGHSAHILEIKRPYEGYGAPADRSSRFVHKCYTYKYSGNFDLLTHQHLRDSIKQTLVREFGADGNDIENAFGLLIGHKIEDIEKLLSSCLIQVKYRWLAFDILKRPLIWALYYTDSSSNNSRESMRDSIDWFHKCLCKLEFCSTCGYAPVPIRGNYPINLRNNTDNSNGWLFHCKGLSTVTSARNIADQIVGLQNIPLGCRLNLFAMGCDGQLQKNMIDRAMISVNGEGLPSLREPLVTSPDSIIVIEEIVHI